MENIEDRVRDREHGVKKVLLGISEEERENGTLKDMMAKYFPEPVKDTKLGFKNPNIS